MDAKILTKRSTTSTDGATIGWVSVGEGPGLVVVHGAMQSGQSQLDLARLLSDHHEVHLVDRRGRGLSGPYPSAPPYTAVEVEDLAAVLAATGATDVLGISVGALIALRAALSVPGIARIAAFEPPLMLGEPDRLEQIERYRRELAGGDVVNAMVTAMLASELGPPFMLKLPRAVLRPGTRRMLAGREALAAALRVDVELVAENADRLDDFAAVRTPTLLLEGTKTRPYLRKAVAALNGVIPGSRRVSLPGTNHGVTQNRDQWGRPDRVAPALLEFFN